MNQPRVGLVGVTCKYESGGQRAEELLSGIKDALKKKNLDVVCAEKVAWDSADAIDVCKQFKKENASVARKALMHFCFVRSNRQTHSREAL